jgi:hypothetical protein
MKRTCLDRHAGTSARRRTGGLFNMAEQPKAREPAS